MTKKKTVLIDLDETVFSFAASWDKWLQHHKNETIDEALYWYYDIDAYIPNFLEEQEEFIKDLKRIKPKPVPEAMEHLPIIAEHYRISALTARNADHWKVETEFWVEKHLPFVEEIHYTRNTKGQPAIPKHTFAEELKAFALIDDTSYWVETLPPHIKGYIVRRPDGLASDRGAITWKEIAEDLLKHAKTESR